MFVIACILLAAAILAFIASFGAPTATEKSKDWRRRLRVGSAMTLCVAVAALVPAMVYTQDPGEAKIQRSISGDVVGETTTEGWHFKAPWVNAITWDVRDNVIAYVGDGETNYSGGNASGHRITVQDHDGVDANIDVTVRYSLDRDKVSALYSRFGTQSNLVQRLIEPSIRSTVREVPAKYGSLDLLTKRSEVQDGIREGLTAAWEAPGIVVEDVAVQEIVQPKAVKDAFARAQEARTNIQAEKARLEAAKIEAEKNRVASEALTPQILQKAYIDAIAKAGTVYVVPQGSQPLITVPTPAP